MKEELNPLFTVSIVTYQQRHLLEECLSSVFCQDYNNIELVLCDDCSCDFDIEEITEYINNNKSENIRKVSVYKQPDSVGTVKNCQKAFELSNGEFLKLHAGDDLLNDPGVISAVYKEFQKKNREGKRTNIIFSRAVAITHDGTLTQDYYPNYDAFTAASNCNAEELFSLIGTRCCGVFVNAPAVFWRRELLEDIGGFSLEYKYTEDWPTWLILCKNGELPYYFNRITVKYRYGGISNAQPEQAKYIEAQHYYESARILREISFPHLIEKGEKWNALYAMQAAKSLEERACMEFEWSGWNTFDKFIWRIKNIRYYSVTILIRAKLGIVHFPVKKALKVDALLGALLCFNIDSIPFGNDTVVISWFLLVSLLATALMVISNFASWYVSIGGRVSLDKYLKKGF